MENSKKLNSVIYGATSAIAEEVAKIWHQRGDRLFLVGRHSAKLETIVNSLNVSALNNRQNNLSKQNTQAYLVESVCYDWADLNNHMQYRDQMIQKCGQIDCVFIAHGYLPSQQECQNSIDRTISVFQINLFSTIAILMTWAEYFERQKFGTIGVITSVAGDCGRQSNYIYGTAKGALNLYLQGLRERLRHSQVSVVTIKPGFVDTPMTQHLQKNFLWVQPRTVACSIVRAIDRKKTVCYVPFFWKYIMLIVKFWYWIRRI